MKTAAKVFIWMGMIFGFYMVYPLVIGIYALKKINHTTSKTDLISFGIVTLFFCSFLGGILMTRIEESPQDFTGENRTIVKTEIVKPPKEKLMRLNGGKVAKYTRIFVWCVVALSLICLACSIINFMFPAVRYYGEYYYSDYYFGASLITDIPIWVHMSYLFVPIIWFICNKQWVNRACGVTFIIMLIVMIVSFCMSFCATIWVSIACHSDIILYWLILLLNTVILALTIAIVKLNKIVFTTAFSPEKRKIVTSALEIRLNELNRLLNNNIITQAEYNTMREKAISNYA